MVQQYNTMKSQASAGW